MRVALAQTDCQLGDVDKNLAEAERLVKDAAGRGAQLVVFPELSLNGYALGTVADDTSLRPGDERLLALSSHGPDVVVGLHEDAGIRRYNSAAYLSGQQLQHVHRKLYLPNYLVWEERKYCSPGQVMRAFDTALTRMAILVCNDAWQPVLPWLAAQDGAEILLVPTNSAVGMAPGSVDTIAYWSDLLPFMAKMQQCWVVFVNRVGEEAGATFWGGSKVLDPWGQLVEEAPLWEPDLLVVDIEIGAVRRRRREMPLLQESRLSLVAREVNRLIQEGADA